MFFPGIVDYILIFVCMIGEIRIGLGVDESGNFGIDHLVMFAACCCSSLSVLFCSRVLLPSLFDLFYPCFMYNFSPTNCNCLTYVTMNMH